MFPFNPCFTSSNRSELGFNTRIFSFYQSVLSNNVRKLQRPVDIICRYAMVVDIAKVSAMKKHYKNILFWTLHGNYL